MNERIRELSKQAWEWADQQEYKDPTQEFSDILEQKFAELILRECISKAEDYGLGCDAVEQLKADFGVE
jgi:hypothetical protein